MHWVRRLSACSRVGWQPSVCSACLCRAARPALRPRSSGHRRSRPSASNGARCSISCAPRSTPSRRSRPPSPLPASGGCLRWDPRSMPALVQLNAITSPIFPGIGRSPVPVLLPFDTASYLDARQSGAPDSLSVSRYQADFRPADLFHAGAAGYDAMFSLEPGAGDGMPQRTFAKPVEVQITGSILIYDLADPLGGKGEPVKALAAQFPDMRRFIREGYVRYAFTRFGVPYVVSIQCLDSTPRRAAAGLPRGLSGRRAFPESAAHRRRPAVAAAPGYLLRRSPSGRPQPRPISAIARAATSSPTAARASRAAAPTSPPIRRSAFRWKRRPAFVRSQSFGRRKSDERNGGYPWQDNFCEARSFEVGQCAGGFGHQGQDIRPGACPAQGSERASSLRSQAAGDRRGSRRRRDPLAEAAGGDAADQHPHRAHPLPLHAHEPVQHGCRRRPQRTPRRRGREDRRGLELSRPSQRHLAAICISTCRCSRATAGSGSIPTPR